jgi:WD40 repeat protein
MRPAILILLVTSALRAETPRLDPYGDRLPEGVTSRIGCLRKIGAVGEAAITPDGARFVAGSNFTLTVRDTRTLAEIRKIPLPDEGRIWRVAISDDGKRVAALIGWPQLNVGWPRLKDGSNRKIAAVWDAASGERLREIEFRDREASGHGFALSSDGKRLAALGLLVNVDEEKGEREVPFGRETNSLQFVAGDRYLVDGDSKDWLCWDAATGRAVECESPPPEILREGRRLSRDGRALFVAQEDALVRVKVDLPTSDRPTVRFGQPEKVRVGEPLQIHRADEKGERCLLRLSAKGPPDSRLVLFDFGAGKAAGSLPIGDDRYGHFYAGTPTANCAILLVWPRPELLFGAGVVAVELPGGKDLAIEQGLKFVSGGLSWMPDGKRLRSDKQLWDARTGKYLGNARPEDLPPDPRKLVERPSECIVDVVTPEGGIAIALPFWVIHDLRGNYSHHPEELQVWNVSTKRKLHELRGRKPKQFSSLNHRGLSGDGGVFAQHDRNELFVWDTGSGRMIAHELIGDDRETAAWLLPLTCPTGREVLCTPRDRLVLFDVPSRTAALDLKLDLPPNQTVTASDRSPDGRLVALATSGGELLVYDLHRAQQVAKRSMEQGTVYGLCFSPDGRSILTQNGLYGLVWPAPEVEPSSRRMKEEEFSAAWGRLRVHSAADCREALLRLIASGEAAAKFLDGKLETERGLTPGRFDALLARLTSNDFRQRAAAEKDLRELDEVAVPRLKSLLEAGTADADLTDRIKRLMEATKGMAPPPSNETLRKLRGIVALESIRTESARKILERLASGAKESAVTREARAALKRTE